MSNDVYTMLRNRLGKFDRNLADVPTAVEVLKMVYQPEDAEFCAKFPEDAMIVKDLADFYGKPEPEMKVCVDNQCKKGFVFTLDYEKGGKKYELMPWLPGVLEISICSHKGTPWLKQFNSLYYQYSIEEAAALSKYKDNTKVLESMLPEPDIRTLPVNVSLPAKSIVHDFENLIDMIRKETIFAAGPCTCRTQSEERGTPCKHDIPEYSCLSFGDAARHYIEYDLAQKITKEECIAIVEKAAKAGAIHNSNNYTESLRFLCNCCPDCCGFFSLIKLKGNQKMISPSNFSPVLTAEACTGCGVCVDRCPIGAVTMSDDIASINSNACIGCGNCVAGCPSEALLMERRSEYKPILKDRKVGMGH